MIANNIFIGRSVILKITVYIFSYTFYFMSIKIIYCMVFIEFLIQKFLKQIS